MKFSTDITNFVIMLVFFCFKYQKQIMPSISNSIKLINQTYESKNIRRDENYQKLRGYHLINWQFPF